MKTSVLLFAVAMAASVAGTVRAEDAHEGPCKEIKEACTKAGFVKGEAKDGKGLWADCVDPLMQGTTAKKSVIPLPTVDPSVVAACKQKHPKFGSGKVGN